jgi:tRNA(Arg) A34 adenosine deaminase TadA
MPKSSSKKISQAERDAAFMRETVAMTFRTHKGPNATCFGCTIVETKTGKPLLFKPNAVGLEKDPAMHAEVRAVRYSCRKLGKPSLKGYTMYTTCEPCPMCMANALWAGLDRVVYGATIDDAAKHFPQIYIYAKDMPALSDLKCVVDGPLERDLCYTLFTAEPIQKAIKLWKQKLK